MSLLSTRSLTIAFGGLTAVNEVDLDITPEEIFSIIGPNGAGKTTVFNAITGLYEPTRGEIRFAGGDLRSPLTGRVVADVGAAGLLSGVATVIMMFLEGLWQAGIIDNYLGGAFPWGKAARDMLGVLGQSPGLAWGSWIAGTLLGGGSAAVIWQRARRTPDRIARQGMARTFQNIHLFQEMTVLENVLVVRETWSRCGLLGMMLRLPGARREEEVAQQKSLELLDFVGLREKAGMTARNLPYGEQRRLEIARALARDPRLLLLDEPAAGMNPTESRELMVLIRKIRDRGVTVLLIEHHMKVVMGISDTIAVLDHGVKIAQGTPKQIQNDPKVLEAYLGREEVE